MEKLPPGDVQHTDRDRAHLLSACILQARPDISANVDEHLAQSWHLTEQMVRDVWRSIDRIAGALLRSYGGLSEDDIADIIDGTDDEDHQQGQADRWTAEATRLVRRYLGCTGAQWVRRASS